MFMRTKSEENSVTGFFSCCFVKVSWMFVFQPISCFSAVLWILYSIILPVMLHWSAHKMVSISKKSTSDKLVFSGTDITLSPTVLADIKVSRRIAEI
jgi:hypothetical protein